MALKINQRCERWHSSQQPQAKTLNRIGCMFVANVAGKQRTGRGGEGQVDAGEDGVGC